MKRFLLAGVLGALLYALPLSVSAAPKTDAVKAPARVPLVTRDNFVSLTFEKLGRSAESYSRLKVFNNSIALYRGSYFNKNEDTNEETSVLSNNQMTDLIRALNARRIASLHGKHGLDDESFNSEKLTLIISDEKNLDRKFVIEHTGSSKLRDYLQFTNYLNALALRKLLSLRIITCGGPRLELPFVSRDNFQSLTLETSGGFAGRQSLIEFTKDDLRGGGKIREKPLTDPTGEQVERFGNFSEEYLQRIFHLINSANLLKLNGKEFKQENLADGFSEVLTLELQDGRKFTVSNYGDTAPPEYSALVQFLNELKNKNLAAQ